MAGTARLPTSTTAPRCPRSGRAHRQRRRPRGQRGGVHDLPQPHAPPRDPRRRRCATSSPWTSRTRRCRAHTRDGHHEVRTQNAPFLIGIVLGNRRAPTGVELRRGALGRDQRPVPVELHQSGSSKGSPPRPTLDWPRGPAPLSRRTTCPRERGRCSRRSSGWTSTWRLPSVRAVGWQLLWEIDSQAFVGGPAPVGLGHVAECPPSRGGVSGGHPRILEEGQPGHPGPAGRTPAPHRPYGLGDWSAG